MSRNSDDGYGSGDGLGSGYSDGYGDGSGDGFGHGDGLGEYIGNIAGYEVFARPTSWGPLVAVGCEARLLSDWKEAWEEVAYGHEIKVEDRKVAELLAKVPQ